MAGEDSVIRLRDEALSSFGSGVDLEYFEILDRHNLKSLEMIEGTRGAVICVAAKVGGVRLIDNVILEPR